ncbi:MAG: STAS domain-containing protein [Prevotella sp.]|nr:STAS domain-containing protein [Prevotella sp.]MBR4601343.1 STAS domain-containing protein [Prevotella sp.]MBR6139393.1 STAS domain-containing protein [Prevotella sp.]
MKTTFKVEDNEFVMYLEGRLDTAASSQAEKDLRALYDCEGHDIVLDCTDLEYISSSGLRLFLNVLKNAHAKGSSVFIKGINDDIRSVLEMTGFNSLFQFR